MSIVFSPKRVTLVFGYNLSVSSLSDDLSKFQEEEWDVCYFPEAYTHPRLQIGQIEEIISSNKKWVILTHSEIYLLRSRLAIVRGELQPSEFVAYWVEDDRIDSEFTVNENGVLSDWADGVFNEDCHLVLEMQKALRGIRSK